MGIIINLQDLIDLRERRKQELEYYTKRLEELNKKLFFIKKDIDLTSYIIELLEKEKLMDLRNITDDSCNT